MKFLVDAQLPRGLALRLREAGHDAIHTLDLPGRNRTTDAEINAVAAAEGRVLVSKDADFVSSLVTSGQPAKLLFVATGNITNDDLEALLLPNLAAVVAAFDACDFVELTRTLLILHLGHENDG